MSAVSGLAHVEAEEKIIATNKSFGPTAVDLTKDSPPNRNYPN